MKIFLIEFAQSEIGPQILTFALKGCSVQLKLDSKNTVKTKQFSNNSFKTGFFSPANLYKAQVAAHNVVTLSKKYVYKYFPCTNIFLYCLK